MAVAYQHKRSTTADAVPTILDGELGINQRDGKLFWKDHNGTVQSKVLTSEAETTTTAGALINGSTAKTTPVDADQVGLMDSAASNVLKKLSWANIKATLKTYFDTLYKGFAETSTGTAIQFDRNRHYGQTTALTGNMTLNSTDAKDGAEVIIRHNHSSAPTVPSEWKKLAGAYVNSVDNTYVVVRFNSTIYYYTIGQVQA